MGYLSSLKNKNYYNKNIFISVLVGMLGVLNTHKPSGMFKFPVVYEECLVTQHIYRNNHQDDCQPEDEGKIKSFIHIIYLHCHQWSFIVTIANLSSSAAVNS